LIPIGPIEGSPIPLLGPHVEYAPEGAAPSGSAAQPGGGSVVDGLGEDSVGSVGDSFLNLVVQANERATSARHMSQAMASGQSDDIHGTMIEVTKAGIETRLMVNVKDKVIDAFYEIWRMNV
jgi:flagellar hook-basal body complex protein FliE